MYLIIFLLAYTHLFFRVLNEEWFFFIILYIYIFCLWRSFSGGETLLIFYIFILSSKCIINPGLIILTTERQFTQSPLLLLLTSFVSEKQNSSLTKQHSTRILAFCITLPPLFSLHLSLSLSVSLSFSLSLSLPPPPTPLFICNLRNRWNKASGTPCTYIGKYNRTIHARRCSLSLSLSLSLFLSLSSSHSSFDVRTGFTSLF